MDAPGRGRDRGRGDPWFLGRGPGGLVRVNRYLMARWQVGTDFRGPRTLRAVVYVHRRGDGGPLEAANNRRFVGGTVLVELGQALLDLAPLAVAAGNVLRGVRLARGHAPRNVARLFSYLEYLSRQDFGNSTVQIVVFEDDPGAIPPPPPPPPSPGEGPAPAPGPAPGPHPPHPQGVGVIVSAPGIIVWEATDSGPHGVVAVTPWGMWEQHALVIFALFLSRVTLREIRIGGGIATDFGGPNGECRVVVDVEAMVHHNRWRRGGPDADSDESFDEMEGGPAEVRMLGADMDRLVDIRADAAGLLAMMSTAESGYPGVVVAYDRFAATFEGQPPVRTVAATFPLGLGAEHRDGSLRSSVAFALMNIAGTLIDWLGGPALEAAAAEPEPSPTPPSTPSPQGSLVIPPTPSIGSEEEEELELELDVEVIQVSSSSTATPSTPSVGDIDESPEEGDSAGDSPGDEPGGGVAPERSPRVGAEAPEE